MSTANNHNGLPEEVNDLLGAHDIRRWRFQQRRRLHTMSTLKRVRLCGWALTGGVDTSSPIKALRCRVPGTGPTLRMVDDRAYWDGVQRCASPHSCPVCAATIRNRYAEEIGAALRRWLLDIGGGVSVQREAVFVTLTIPHDIEDGLQNTLDALNLSARKLLQSRRWRAFKARWGVAGYVSLLDSTLGRNGWHPHFHAALFLDRVSVYGPLLGKQQVARELALAEFRRELSELWSHSVARVWGRKVSATHGVHCEMIKDGAGIGAYVSKVSLELGRSDLKTKGAGKSPFALLGEIVEGCDPDGWAAWHEHEQATAGKRVLRWSVGLRRELGLLDEKTDAELLEVKGSTAVAMFSAKAWEKMRRSAQGMLSPLEQVEWWRMNEGTPHELEESLKSVWGDSVQMIGHQDDDGVMVLGAKSCSTCDRAGSPLRESAVRGGGPRRVGRLRAVALAPPLRS